MHTRYLAAVLALAGALLAGTGSAGAAPSGCGWTLLDTPPVPGSNTLASSPLPGASIVTPAYGTLDGVDARSPTDVRISGSEVYPQSTGWLLHVAGGSVSNASPQLPALPLTAPLSAAHLSYDSAGDGWVLTDQTGATPDAERWHDGRWTLVQMAPLGGDRTWPDFYTQMFGVVALSPTNAWAIGGIFQGIPLIGTAIEHWDGASWQLVPQPLADQPTKLNAISAASPDDIWVVGDRSDDAGALVPVAEHWDGTRWNLAHVPPGSGDSVLLAVSATGPHDAWAVGGQTLPGSDGLAVPMTERYDGKSWQTVTIPDTGNSELTGVYASGPDDVWATGEFAFGLKQVFLHWAGRSWTPVAVPGPQKYNTQYVYNAIDGSAMGDVWAVGEINDFGNQTSYPALAHLRCQS